MRIAIHGSGRMGSAVADVARERGHEIVGTFDRSNPLPDELNADALIDFSSADAIDRVFDVASRTGVLLVTGTTGWNERRDGFRKLIETSGGACVHASNFSIGANVMFRLAAIAARELAGVDGYEAGIEERHHSRKKDAPSGTALSIAAAVRDGAQGSFDPPIAASRVGEEFGLHTLFFDSADDVVEITHRARGRNGFARGAVVAAERAVGRRGWIELQQLLFGEAP